MGFRTGAYATVWEVSPHSERMTKVRMSISHKNKMTGEYENDYSGYCMFAGSGAAASAMKLKERDRIRLGDVEVKTKYDKDKKITYYNFYVYSFEMVNGNSGSMSNRFTPVKASSYGDSSYNDPNAYDGDYSEDNLPF